MTEELASLENNIARPCTVSTDPETYDRAQCVARRYKGDRESRWEHIYNGHGRDLVNRLGPLDKETLIAELAEVAQSETSRRVVADNGNTVHIDVDRGIVVVSRDKPFKYSGKSKDMRTPPEPPIIVTAYTLESRGQVDKILNKYTAPAYAG